MGILSVLVDTREPTQIQKLAFGGAEKVVTQLDAGDLWVTCADGALLGIERKTPGDLLNTLRAERLFPQLVRLRELTPWAYLVVCGGLYPGANDRVWFDDGSAMGSRETGWSWASVQGALLSCQEIGVHVVFCNGLLDFEPTVLRLAERSRAPVRVPPVRDALLLDEREAFLGGLPGIGPERAQALLAACGTPAWALHALTELDGDAVRVPGVGPKTREHVRRFLGLADDQELTPVIRHEDGTEEQPAPPALAGVAA